MAASGFFSWGVEPRGCGTEVPSP